MNSCPIPSEFEPLVEHAVSVGIPERSAVSQALRAYMIHNSSLKAGEEPTMPTNDEFNKIMDDYNIFINSPDRQTVTEAPVGSKDYFADMENAFPWYKVIREGLQIDTESQSNLKGRAIVKAIAEKLSSNLGVPYQFVTAAEAQEITKDVNVWSGQPAFYFGDTIYILPELATEKSVFHEFAHPLVRAVATANPELFKNLYNQVMATSKGQALLEKAKTAYPSAAPNDPILIEEVLVMALTQAATDTTDSAFNKFISNLLYAIKQLLRRVFGKVKVEKLNPNTTIGELADMLMMEEFDIDTKSISREDIAAYMTEYDNLIESINKLSQSTLQESTDELFNMISGHIQLIKNNKDYKAMDQILKDLYQRSDLKEIYESLAPYQSKNEYLINEMTRLQQDAEFAKQHTKALLDSLLRLSAMTERVQLELKKLVEDMNSQDNVGKVFYFNNIMNSWDEFLSGMEATINNELQTGNIKPNNPIIALVGSIRTKISYAQQQANKVYAEGVSQVLKSQIAPMKTAIDDKYDQIMEDLRRRNAPPSIIAQKQKDYWGLEGPELAAFLDFKNRKDKGLPMSSIESKNYELLKEKSYREGAYLTDEKIDYLMTGKLGDSHALNSFMEGFVYNQDPIVFGFAGWVKDNLTEVFTSSQRKGNAFLNEVKPLLEAAGYNQSNPAAFGKRATFRDKKGGLDKDGNYVTKDVNTIINPWKDYRSDISRLENEIRAATEMAYASGNNDEVLRLKKEKRDYEQKYFHTPYTEDYYKRFNVFNQGPGDIIGAKAEAARNELLSRIQNLTTSIGISTTNENFDTRDELANLWREYRQLHSNYTSAGQLKDAEGIKIAERLREFRNASKDLYDNTLIPELFTGSLTAYEQSLIDQGYEKWGVPFMKLRNKWIEKNTRTVIKDNFYTEQKRITDEIKQISSRLPKNVQAEFDLSKHYEKLLQLMNPYRDEDNQPEATAMDLRNIEAIKETQELINLAKENLPRLTGLTQLEHATLSNYYEKLSEGEPVTQQERDEVKVLLDKKSQFGLSKEDKARLYELYAELGELQKSYPTDYYMDMFNNYLSLVDMDLLESNFDMKDVTMDTADRVLNMDFYNTIVSTNPEFKEWFDKNHIIKTVTDKFGVKTRKIERVKAWSVVRPRNIQYYDIFSFTNSLGQPESIVGMPNHLYYERTVKQKFVTKPVSVLEAIEQGDITKANVDNKGNWLPRLDIDDKKYVNEKFFNIRDTDKNLYNAIIALTKWHFTFQENSPNSSKLGFDIPRYRKEGLESRMEYFTAEGKLENPISRWWRRFRAMWKPAADDADEGYNFKDQLMMMDGEVYNDENAGIPITGLSALEPDDVSLDLTYGMLKFMIASEKQRKLVEMNPMARALQMVMRGSEDAINEFQNINKRTQKNNSTWNLVGEKTTLGKSKGKSIRETAIDNFIEREFEGVVRKGVLGKDKDNAFVNKLVDNIMKLSAFGYFAMDIPSGLKNSFSARIQSIQEAAGGKYYNMTNYAKGVAWSNKTMWEISLNVNKFGPKSHDEQLVEIFDAVQGRFEEKFADHGSRSLTKDALGGLTWMTSFRKWTELNSSLSIFGAMLHHEKNVEQTINGVTKRIAYIDAWETVDNQIRLKEGVDPEWGINGVKFKAFKNKVQGVNNSLNGSFAKFDYAEADKFMAFRFVIAFKRWFIRMFLNRYQFRGSWRNPKYRYDAAVGDTVMGFHVEAMRALFRGIQSRGEYFTFLSPSEKAALWKTTMDVAYLILFSMAISMIFGFDEDDEDKFEKLRDRSGPLPFFGVSENEADFKLGGWLTNHALLMTMQLKNETVQWLPLPGLGADNYLEMLKMDAIAMKNTLDNYKKMGGALILVSGNALFGTDSTKAYWDQREGPYSWMQEGEEGSKALSYFFRSFGVTGKSLDPAQATTNWVKSANWR
jgi:hypothetical protein